VLIVAIRLREIPDGTLGLIVTPSPNNRGPLPHIPNHIHHSKGTGACGMAVNAIGRAQRSAPIRNRDNVIELINVSPWVSKAARPLRSVLPLPFMRKPLARPLGIGTGIFD
jgi:hypothetical protein